MYRIKAKQADVARIVVRERRDFGLGRPKVTVKKVTD